MANVITHVYTGTQVFEGMPHALQNEIKRYRDAFLFGNVGPDFLLFLRELGTKSGYLFNRVQYSKAYEVFCALADYIAETESVIAKSYVLGLLCHYVMDTQLHPFVYFFCEEGFLKELPTEQKQGTHQLIENALDSFVVTELMGLKHANAYDCSRKDFKPCRAVRREVGRIYNKVVAPILGVPVSKFHVKLAIKGTRFSMRFFTDKSGRKREYFSKKEAGSLVLGKKRLRNMYRPPEFYQELDFLNFNGAPFRKVRNQEETSTLSAPEIVKETFELCQKYIARFVSAINKTAPLNKTDFRINYEGIDTIKE
ncbi:MAG: zinc dependent phospholipase C family protein [Firmicutes bacterium]|nr:zinc dependent phospholipase C family protein [Bacillota bacterium]